ncbi:hypothetical protein LB577_08750 [Mesorhizobium sp. B283B1A]|nr:MULTISPECIES: hypothetical protein [Mesorhizobium]MCA0047046.1 hypothetical protein [Mesorhizobium sp. B283B1A]UQS65420.1 hypothetical protein M5D98_03350 [Mesorhizobium opportunistum]
MNSSCGDGNGGVGHALLAACVGGEAFAFPGRAVKTANGNPARNVCPE